ncbi:unnamed protein product [Prorocentrum cordatum]|nr:unnamed protein product [Polarella glacialis]
MASLKRGLAQCTAAASIGIAGDVGMQMLEGSALLGADVPRALRLAAYRAVQAPVVDRIWQAFDRLILVKGLPGAAAKALADQCLIMPPSLTSFFVSQGLMEGLSCLQSLERAQQSLLPAAQAAVPYWLSVHMITFSVVPEHLRIVWASLCATLWNVLYASPTHVACERPGSAPRGPVPARDPRGTVSRGGPRTAGGAPAAPVPPGGRQTPPSLHRPKSLGTQPAEAALLAPSAPSWPPARRAAGRRPPRPPR